MRKIATSLFLFFFMGIVSSSYAQFIATGGCNAVSIWGAPASTGLYVLAENSHYVSSDCKLVLLEPNEAARTYHLYKKREDGTFLRVFWPVKDLNTINNHFISNGTFKIKIKEPVKDSEYTHPPLSNLDCNNVVNGRVYKKGSFNNTVGIGWVGYYQTYWTNEFVIGATVPEDINIDLIDDNGNDEFEYETPVMLDLTECRNYNRYSISIQQLNSNNWNGTGLWMNGTIDEIDLRDIWRLNHPNWNLWAGHTYRVQVAMSNADCWGPWSAKTMEFSICPQGAGCRIVEETADLSVMPNPASEYFTISNFYPQEGKDYQVLLHDYTGKLLKEFKDIKPNGYDISDLPNGIYVISIWEAGALSFTSKLSVLK